MSVRNHKWFWTPAVAAALLFLSPLLAPSVQAEKSSLKKPLRTSLSTIAQQRKTLRPSLVETESAALKFLNRYPEINIAFNHAPGNGHFASTRLVMDRLRDIGYKGKFNIYIPEGLGQKIYHFLPGYDPKGPSGQQLPVLNAETFLMPQNSYSANSADSEKLPELVNAPKRIAFVGGEDHGLSPATVNSDALIVVQPTGWFNPPEIRISSAANPSVYYKVLLTDKKNLPLYDVVPKPKDPLSFVKDHMVGSDALLAKSPGVVEMVKHLDQHEVLSVYGVSYREGPKKLATLLKSVVWDQTEKVGGATHGVIVPMISNFNETEWADFEKRFESDAYKPYRSKIKIVSVTGEDLKESLATLEKGHVLVVKTGTVSQDVWNYLMSRSTYPPMAAGTTGGTYLGNLGKPFFNAAGVNSGVDDVTQAHMSRAYQDLMNENVEDLNQFLIEARDPNRQMMKDYQNYAVNIKKVPEKVGSILDHITTDNCFVKIMQKAVPEPKAAAQAQEMFAPVAEALQNL